MYMHSPEASTNTFAYEARRLIENEDGYREGWGYCGSRRATMEALTHPDTRHIADYTRIIETEELTEDTLHLYAQPQGRGVYFLGPIVSHLALQKPLPRGPECGRCLERASLIGIADIAPWGPHRDIQHTIMYQCPACGYYRHCGFDDGNDWTSGRLSYRTWVRLLPDPFVKTGRLRITYEAGGRRLNLDGVSLFTSPMFELFVDGAYQRGRVEVGDGDRFYFIFSDPSRPDTDLLPGMLARLLP